MLLYPTIQKEALYMNVDRIISESLSDKAGEFEIGEYKYEEMLKYIEGEVDKKNRTNIYKLINRIKNFAAAFHFKDFIEAAAFIMVLIAIPVMVNGSNSIPRKNSSSKEATKVASPSEIKVKAIDPKIVNLDQAVKDGSIAMLSDIDAGGINKVYNIDKLDRFMDNYKNGKKDSVRIMKFAQNKSNTLINSIVDLSYDGSRLELIGYDLYSEKTMYKATAPSYFAKIARLETKDGIRYSLCEKVSDADNMGMTLISFSKIEEKSIPEEQLSSEACYKYLKDNDYDIVTNSGAGGLIQLPDSFNMEKDGVKIGELLKDRNEKSIKETNLDFSSYLGKKVYLETAGVRKNNSEEKEIVILSMGEKIIGVWSYPRIQENESRQSDFTLLMNILKQ